MEQRHPRMPLFLFGVRCEAPLWSASSPRKRMPVDHPPPATSCANESGAVAPHSKTLRLSNAYDDGRPLLECDVSVDVGVTVLLECGAEHRFGPRAHHANACPLTIPRPPHRARTKAVLRTALQNREPSTHPSLSPRSYWSTARHKPRTDPSLGFWSAARQRRFGSHPNPPAVRSRGSAKTGRTNTVGGCLLGMDECRTGRGPHLRPRKAVLPHRTPKPRAKHSSIALAAQFLECGATAPLWFAKKHHPFAAPPWFANVPPERALEFRSNLQPAKLTQLSPSS